ncbi:hypothetical protein PTSG_03332 [Salpingoeca rosetta]|uniref:Cytidyltransferase-like domain-containing protein n=1 Tax=Salpingoeca rosetta (strain ATCC 50818 / BSB-021) TaxID=946362 RepID=F2U4V5_SALR5|nr:uncharacterized protein PTSG_03332 [Salpingoeca rosetta]EGD82671.1 hypothetical protein PTSG_03332 [Salpingoeca rosetta]|eukprot:XP_004995907.1 hypothetical protein PTSG_03332 [Salpingoeca rosetta]
MSAGDKWGLRQVLAQVRRVEAEGDGNDGCCCGGGDDGDGDAAQRQQSGRGRRSGSGRGRGQAKKKQYALLLMTGSLNPIHAGHIHMMYAAREKLQAVGFHVVHGWISPSHDLYVQMKARRKDFPWMTSRLRVHLTRLALESHPWLSCGTWESEVEGWWPNFPEVACNLKESVKETLIPEEADLGARITVFYVAGQDHVERAGLNLGMKPFGIGLVCVTRGRERADIRDRPRNLFWVASTPEHHRRRSSTVVRQHLLARKAIGRHVPPVCKDELTREPLLSIFTHGHFDEDLTHACEAEYFRQYEQRMRQRQQLQLDVGDERLDDDDEFYFDEEEEREYERPDARQDTRLLLSPGHGTSADEHGSADSGQSVEDGVGNDEDEEEEEEEEEEGSAETVAELQLTHLMV